MALSRRSLSRSAKAWYSGSILSLSIPIAHVSSRSTKVFKDPSMKRSMLSLKTSQKSLNGSMLIPENVLPLHCRAREVQGHTECVKLPSRSEEHTSELQSPCNLVCRLLLEKKKTYDYMS